MRLRRLPVTACIICLFGCATPESRTGKADVAHEARISARLTQYSGQDANVEAAMKGDAEKGEFTQLLSDILKDAELRARSAMLSRYIQEAEGGVKPSPAGAWLLNQVAGLQRATQETDKKAASLAPLLASAPVSETTAKQLVDLTGHRGWDKGTAEELLAIAGDMAADKASTVDEQNRREAVQQLNAYQAARVASASLPPPPSPSCTKMSLDGGCMTP